MRLSELKPGESAKVTGVDVNGGYTLRLMTLGIVEGSVVRCLTKFNEAMELKIHNSATFAIHTNTAASVLCERHGNS